MLEKKKIFFYTDTPIYGGAERHMLLLAQKTDPNKFQISLICPNHKSLDEWCKQWESSRFPVYRLLVNHKHDPRHYFQLKKLLTKEKPEILHIHLWNPGACRYAFGAVNPKHTKIIATEHDPFELKGIKRTIKRKTIEKTTQEIAVSEANRKLLIKLYPELKGKICTIHNGIDLKKFTENIAKFTTQERTKIRKRLFNANNKDIVVTSVAALHPRKGLIYLIKAFADLPDNQNAKLAIVGEGPERKTLERLIKSIKMEDKIFLLGKRDDIPQILSSSDIFILTSIKEAFGLALIEAQIAGLPVIASKTGGIPEIIEHNKNGLLTEPKYIDSIKDALARMIKHPALRQKLAYVGKNRVLKFDASEMAKKTEKVYLNVTG